MSTIRFIMVGGFLGAGKTTTLGRLARHFQERGEKVGLVTNDQAEDLVDTHSLRRLGLPVAEVAGACFCCKFDDLIHQVDRLVRDEQPSVILAEPVGSCTDLVATVAQPLMDLYGDRFSVAPYAVLFKPSHGLPILRGDDSGFSHKAAYIFRKQLEEADIIVLNRIDELSEEERIEMTGILKAQYPGVPLVQMSARTGEGFETFVAQLDRPGRHGQRILDIDYDIYAEGEAELGWLNSSGQVQARKPFALDEFLLAVLNTLGSQLKGLGAQVAHIKAIGESEGATGVANLVSSRNQPELSRACGQQVTVADVIVNARVALDPAVLRGEVERSLTGVCQARGVELAMNNTRSFRPGRPTPTHRYTLESNAGRK